MNTNEEMLQFLYKNASMSIESTTKMMEKTSDTKLKSDLSHQIDAYNGFAKTAAAKLASHGLKPQDNKASTKLMTNFGIMLNTMIDTTPSHIAEIMINGSNMGVIKMQKHLNRNTDCPDDTRKLCREVMDYEKDCVNKLGGYLR